MQYTWITEDTGVIAQEVEALGLQASQPQEMMEQSSSL